MLMEEQGAKRIVQMLPQVQLTSVCDVEKNETGEAALATLRAALSARCRL